MAWCSRRVKQRVRRAEFGTQHALRARRATRSHARSRAGAAEPLRRPQRDPLRRSGARSAAAVTALRPSAAAAAHPAAEIRSRSRYLPQPALRADHLVGPDHLQERAFLRVLDRTDMIEVSLSTPVDG